MELGTIIKKIRKQKGISGKFVAKEMKIHPSTLSKYESNNRKIDAKLLPDFAGVLGVEVQDFFKQNVDETPTYDEEELTQ